MQAYGEAKTNMFQGRNPEKFDFPCACTLLYIAGGPASGVYRGGIPANHQEEQGHADDRTRNRQHEGANDQFADELVEEEGGKNVDHGGAVTVGA